MVYLNFLVFIFERLFLFRVHIFATDIVDNGRNHIVLLLKRLGFALERVQVVAVVRRVVVVIAVAANKVRRQPKHVVVALRKHIARPLLPGLVKLFVVPVVTLKFGDERLVVIGLICLCPLVVRKTKPAFFGVVVVVVVVVGIGVGVVVFARRSPLTRSLFRELINIDIHGRDLAENILVVVDKITVGITLLLIVIVITMGRLVRARVGLDINVLHCLARALFCADQPLGDLPTGI